jgi:endo-1,4-beta-xylanase
MKITQFVARAWYLLLFLAILPHVAGQSLREKADRAGILLGTAVRPDQLSEPAYTSTLAREFNILEPENAMKWAVIRPERGVFDFSQADRIVSFARTHSMKVRGHVLVWGHSNPAWLAQAALDPRGFSEVLHEHIAKVAGHFRSNVFAWDVVNEAFDEKGNLRPSIWYDQPGIGFAGEGTRYIEQAFRWAHEADPDALLFYNDAEGEAVNAKSDAVYAMVKDFRSRGVPIDGVGLQMHIFDLKPDLQGIEANIARFTKLGVQVHITEMDVALPTNADGSAKDANDLSRQAEIYLAVASACIAHPGCTAIQTWGFTDKYSWIRSTTKGAKGAALLFDRDYGPKPAYSALKLVLSAHPVGEQ